MVRSTEEKGKAKAEEFISKEESFAQLLMGGEEDFEGYLQENETLDDDPTSNLDPPLHDLDDYDEDDNDSLDAWMKQEEEKDPQQEVFIEDNELT